MSAGGKGDAPRPFSVAREDFEARWDAIFGNKKAAEGSGLRKMVDEMVVPPRFCPDCGKRVSEGHIHTCSPQAKRWRGLTGDDVDELIGFHFTIDNVLYESEARDMIVAIERLLRERNE